LRVGGPGDGLIAFGATMYRCALPWQVQLGAIGPAHVLSAETFVRDGAKEDWDSYRGSLLPYRSQRSVAMHEILKVRSLALPPHSPFVAS
jgi:hypothetical protein